MMKVGNLKKNSHLTYTVSFTDSEGQITSYVVSEDLVVSHRLIKGKVLDETTFRHFLADYSIDSMLLRTQSLLNRYPKTIYETEEYLRKLEVSEPQIHQIITRLIQKRYLDDENYVRLFIEKSFFLNGNGPLKIEYELRMKGIEDALIKSALAHISEAMIQKNLNQLFDKKLLTLSTKPKAKAVILMKQYLYQKGYELSICEGFVSKRSHLFTDEESEKKLLEKDYQKYLKKLHLNDLSSYEINQKLISHLMARGYRYDTIKQYIEGRKS